MELADRQVWAREGDTEEAGAEMGPWSPETERQWEGWRLGCPSCSWSGFRGQSPQGHIPGGRVGKDNVSHSAPKGWRSRLEEGPIFSPLGTG